ncbi:hypothetical protein BpHYR1_040168 [Brachionus plicatilis]|uniref:Uncharacterized protein n=1 Tax=Brachionus plicatilis TaxID=10195 RepID=A0A3M7QS60_BRAPC|nr:hypothetical protein BpHYR1_040168 [Brachionus plicatilis]
MNESYNKNQLFYIFFSIIMNKLYYKYFLKNCNNQNNQFFQTIPQNSTIVTYGTEIFLQLEIKQMTGRLIKTKTRDLKSKSGKIN